MTSVGGQSRDIISSLPENIIETILLCLPIRDAVRTSILSRKWRYRWVTIPELVFDDKHWQESSKNRHSAKTKLKLALAIHQVLLLHQGPILKFTLSISGLESCSEIDQSLLFLSRNGVEDFTLKWFNHNHYKLPASLFSCKQLQCLRLHSCVFKPPPIFKGFDRLTSLKFTQVFIDRDVIESLISSCPLLTRVTLIGSASYDSLEINARNLKRLVVRGISKFLCFRNAQLLAEVSIDTNGVIDEKHFNGGEAYKLNNVFGTLPGIKFLHMNYAFVKSCSVGGVSKSLSTPLVKLKVLSLFHIDFQQLDMVSCTLCLIRSSPTLKKITITAIVGCAPFIGPALEFLEEQHYSDIVLEKLKK